MIIKRPFFLFACGSIVSLILYMLGSTFLAEIFIISAVLVCTFLCLLRSQYARHLAVISAAAVISVLIATVSFTNAQFVQTITGYSMSVQGTVYSVPEEKDKNSCTFIINNCSLNGMEINGKIYVYAQKDENIEIGDKISFFADIQDYSSEGVYKFHSLSTKTFLIAFADENIQITEKHKGFSIFRYITELSASIRGFYRQQLPSDNAAIISALITGDTSDLPDSFINSLRYCGASHIFAVSGMHLSLWCGIFFIILKQRAKSAKLPNIAAIIFVILYCIFTGFSPSVMRSGIMLITVFSAKLVRRSADPLNSLGIAASILLIFNPFLAGNVSFLLSTVATFALIAVAPILLPEHNYKKGNRHLKRRLFSITDSFIISVTVILTTLPVCAIFFGYISLLSPVSSIVITPVAELLMIFSAFMVFIPAGNILSDIFIRISVTLSDLVIKICEFLSKADFVIIPVDTISVIIWVILVLIIVAFVLMGHKTKKKLSVIILSSILVFTSISAFRHFYSSDDAYIYIPCGENATEISIVSKHGICAVIYGTGGSFDYTRQTVSYLNSKGTLSADTIIIPRNRKTENNNTEYLQNKLNPLNTINLTDTTVYEKIYTSVLWNGAELYCRTEEFFSAAILYINGTKAVICSLPSSDFSQAEKEFTYGDILICRSNIPETLDISLFDKVIIITDKQKPYISDSVITTKNTDIEIVLKGDSYVINR